MDISHVEYMMLLTAVHPSFSPKAIRFLIEAVEHYQAYHEERLQDEHLTEEEAADLTNDHQYLEALKTDLKHHQDKFVCKGSSPTKIG